MTTPNETLPREAQPYTIHASAAPPIERTRVLKHDDTFGVFNEFGDLDASVRGEEGIFHRGTRYLSCFRLTALDARPLLLSSTVRQDNVLMAVDLTNPDVFADGHVILPHSSLHIYRTQFLWKAALHTRLQLRNYAAVPIEMRFGLSFDADFKDIFEVRGEVRKHRGRLRAPELRAGGRRIVLGYEGLDGEARRTTIVLPPEAVAHLPSHIEFSLRLEPAQEKDLNFVCCFDDDADSAASQEHGTRAELDYASTLKQAGASTSAPDRVPALLSTSNEQFDIWLERSRNDLNMLLTSTRGETYPYAGVPWFSTPFGRDGIITALECLWIAPHIARGVLRYLTDTQAKAVSSKQDAQPGKILHESRDGEMAALGEVPFGRYYGSVDATPLYVLLAGAYFRRTADLAFLESIWPGIELALRWIDEYGDADRDGFVEYSKMSPQGLTQQGWKDSHDSVFHANGALAEPPIALCEVQGYVYAAKLAAGAVASALGEAETALRLTTEASQLRKKFESAFWCESIGAYALALDGNKRPCEVRTSNAAQCLFGGIATHDHALAMARSIESEHFFSGWGVRTVADGEPRYNPMSYHNGSVWPHDNALIASGLSRYRLTGLAAKLLQGFFEASAYFELNRLPELFCGFRRRHGKAPTLYPVACSPQAWSAGAAFLLLQSSIGMTVDAVHRRIVLSRPVLPSFLEQLRLRGILVGQASVDLVLFRSGSGVAVTVERRSGEVEVVVSN